LKNRPLHTPHARLPKLNQLVVDESAITLRIRKTRHPVVGKSTIHKFDFFVGLTKWTPMLERNPFNIRRNHTLSRRKSDALPSWKN